MGELCRQKGAGKDRGPGVETEILRRDGKRPLLIQVVYREPATVEKENHAKNQAIGNRFVGLHKLP